MQSLNRYAYVANNPLSYIDPSGYFKIDINDTIELVMNVAVAVLTAALGTVCAPCAAVFAAAWVKAKGGSNDAAMLAAFTAFVGGELSQSGAAGAGGAEAAGVVDDAVSDVALEHLAGGSPATQASGVVNTAAAMEEMIVIGRSIEWGITFVAPSLAAGAAPIAQSFSQIDPPAVMEQGSSQTTITCDSVCKSYRISILMEESGWTPLNFYTAAKFVEVSTMIGLPASAAAKVVVKEGVEAGVSKGISGVPGRVQSRINLQNGTNKYGMKHILKEHLSGKANKSQFNMNEDGLRELLQSKQVVDSPIVNTIQSKAHGTLYVRQVDVGRVIGNNYLKNNSPTSMLTTQSDKYGNLVTAFPGI